MTREIPWGHIPINEEFNVLPNVILPGNVSRRMRKRSFAAYRAAVYVTGGMERAFSVYEPEDTLIIFSAADAAGIVFG